MMLNQADFQRLVDSIGDVAELSQRAKIAEARVDLLERMVAALEADLKWHRVWRVLDPTTPATPSPSEQTGTEEGEST